MSAGEEFDEWFSQNFNTTICSPIAIEIDKSTRAGPFVAGYQAGLEAAAKVCEMKQCVAATNDERALHDLVVYNDAVSTCFKAIRKLKDGS